MTKQEVFAAIKNLVAPVEETTVETTEVKFERVALEGGEVFITNQTEGEIALGDAIYVEVEGGNFELAPSGLHRLEDGREIVLDEESVVTEIREEGEAEVEEEAGMEDKEEASSEVEEAMETATQIDELKTAIHDLLMAFESYTKETDERFNELKADYEGFKKSAEYTPAKQDNSFKAKFSAYEQRLNAIKGLKNK